MDHRTTPLQFFCYADPKLLPFGRLAADTRSSPPRWYTPGVTPRGQQTFITKQERATFHVAVFVKLGQKPIVVVVHKGSDQAQEAEARAGTSSNKKGAGAYTMSGADYIKIVEEKLMGHPNTPCSSSGWQAEAGA